MIHLHHQGRPGLRHPRHGGHRGRGERQEAGQVGLLQEEEGDHRIKVEQLQQSLRGGGQSDLNNNPHSNLVLFRFHSYIEKRELE